MISRKRRGLGNEAVPSVRAPMLRCFVASGNFSRAAFWRLARQRRATCGRFFFLVSAEEQADNCDSRQSRVAVVDHATDVAHPDARTRDKDPLGGRCSGGGVQPWAWLASEGKKDGGPYSRLVFSASPAEVSRNGEEFRFCRKGPLKFRKKRMEASISFASWL